MSVFNNIYPRSKTRNFGGTNIQNVCEPYLTGYHFIKWYLPPSTLHTFVTKYPADTGNGGESLPGNNQKIEDMLSACCMSVTPPGQNIEFVEYQGSCGVKWNNPVRVMYGSSITVKYVEMTGLPVFKIHKCWIDMIRDAHQGVPGQYEPSTGGSGRSRNDFAGTLLYWTTKPDGVTIEYYAAYSGVIPEKDHQESFTSDISSVDKLEMDVTYRIDHIWTDPWVYEEVKKVSKSAGFSCPGATLWSKDGIMNNRNNISKI